MMSKWGIRAKVLLMALTPPILIAMCLGLFLVQTQITTLENSLVERGKTITKLLASTCENGIYTKNVAVLRSLVEKTIEQQADVKYVAIESYDPAFSVQDTKPEQQNSVSQAFVADLLKIFLRNDIQLQFEENIKRKDFKTDNGNHYDPVIIGKVTLEVSIETTIAKQSLALLNSVLITLIAIIVSALIGLWTSHTVTSPILRLTDSIELLEKGKLETRVPEDSGGEIGKLESGINTMASSLQQAQEELQEKVEIATLELRETLEAVEIQNVELDIARKKALDASQVKSEFLANMSHEIRTPINGILGFTDLLSHSNLDDEQLEYLNTIKESGANLLAIINDILDFSKIEAGKLVIDNIAFDLRDCVEEVFSLLAPAAYGKNLELVHLLYSDVPFKLHGDPIRIRQILTNLVHNAIKFTHSGRVVVRVMLDEDGENETLIRITVADTGIGLSEDEQKKLFNAFSQADTSTTRRFGGAGLGLVISKKLVEQMGGNIGLESSPEKGSTFWFTLRLKKQRIRQDDPNKEKKTPLNNRRLLLFDELPLSRLAIRHILESWNIDITEVDNNHSFVSLLSSNNNWDLALVGLSRTDINSSGFQKLMSRLEGVKVPIIALANTVDRNELKNLFLQGAPVALPKTIRRQTLYREMCRILLDPESATSHIAPAGETHSGVVKTSDTVTPNTINTLIVDDNRINRKLACTLVRKMGAAVSEAENGQEAISIAKDGDIDLILMDIHMPIMNGEDAAKEIRKIYSGKKQPIIIALTANAMPGEKDRLINNGLMNGCLIKPITEEQLGSIVNDCAKIKFSESRRYKPQKENSNNKGSLEQELFDMLKAELPLHKERITTNYNEGDSEALRDSVHKLHGAASVCGVHKLKSACSKLENLLIDKELEKIPPPYNSLIEEINKIV